MDNEYLQNLRYKLKRRVKRLNSAHSEIYHYLIKQFWGFLQKYPIYCGILDDLKCRYPDEEEKAYNAICSKKAQFSNDESENAALSYFIIKKCAESDNGNIEYSMGMAYKSVYKTNDEAVMNFSKIYINPLYEYLDEHLDDQRAILALLNRYKHKCEWFQRDSLINLSEQGERKLAEHLYEYLYDQGLNFMIEPSSASGEADLVSIQKGDEPLIADTKIFDGKSRGKSYITKGFRQIYDYTKDYNEPFGYMIIYKTCEKEPEFLLSHQTQSTLFVTHNNKTIFLVTIDIHKYKETASKRGTLKAIKITEEDLIKDIS